MPKAGGAKTRQAGDPRMIKPMVGFDMRAFLFGFLHDSSGATAVEYGIIAAAMAVVVVAAMNAITPGVLAKFNAVAASFP